MENAKNAEPVFVPYVVHRDTVAHDRWIIKLLVKAIIACVVLIFASNAIWLYAWTRYDYTSSDSTTMVDSEGGGIATYNSTGGDGGIISYGESYSPQAHDEEDAQNE